MGLGKSAGKFSATQLQVPTRALSTALSLVTGRKDFMFGIARLPVLAAENALNLRP